MNDKRNALTSNGDYAVVLALAGGWVRWDLGAGLLLAAATLTALHAALQFAVAVLSRPRAGP